jgi:hypothetical protein
LGDRAFAILFFVGLVGLIAGVALVIHAGLPFRPVKAPASLGQPLTPPIDAKLHRSPSEPVSTLIRGEDVPLADIDLDERQGELLTEMALAGIGTPNEAFRCFASDLGHDEDDEGRPILHALPEHNISSNPQTYDLWHSGLAGRHRRAEKQDLEVLASYNLIALQTGQFGVFTTATLGRRGLAYAAFLEGKGARPN